MEADLEKMVELAKEGDREALKYILLEIKDSVLGLSIRMLGSPVYAEDECQEIFIKIITHLSGFRGESTFKTWVYRVAANHLLSARKKRAERGCSNFDDFADEIDRGLANGWQNKLSESEIKLRVDEMMISCTQGMLLYLDRDHRLAYIPGEVFEVSGEQGGYILGITPEAFRKRLSRSRKRLYNFMKEYCGFIDPSNPCRCEKHVLAVTSKDARESPAMVFTAYPCRGKYDPDIIKRLNEYDELKRVAVIFHNHPDYTAPDQYVDKVRELIDSGRFDLFNGQN
jgi:RNA polymerase sigma factor (sigma-70 family)